MDSFKVVQETGIMVMVRGVCNMQQHQRAVETQHKIKYQQPHPTHNIKPLDSITLVYTFLMHKN